MPTAVFSIISPNYRHFARVLMDSVRRTHPEWERFVVLAGGEDSHADDEPFTTVPLEALSLPNARCFAFRYTLLELNTAVKPWMFESLFARGFDRVIYLDPDVVLYSRLEELDALPAETFLTLTPHLTSTADNDEHHPNQRSILLAGAYNLGFLAVSRQPQLERFLAWWKEKLEFECVVDTARGLFVDQKWMDLAPGLFAGVSILRHEGYNVAYWNLRQRTVTGEGAGATVNGAPLRFFHFSGFDPASPHLVSRHDPRMLAADFGDAARLFENYAAAVRAAGHESFRDERYALAFFHDGTPVRDIMRVAYRNSETLQAACGTDPYAHPELFPAFAGSMRASLRSLGIGQASYRVLSRARPLVRLVPLRLRTAMREVLLGYTGSARPPRVTNQRRR